jgi:integrase
MKLTKATVSGLVLPAGETDLKIFDDDLPRFGVRLRAGRKRTTCRWVVQHRLPGGRQRLITLGDVRTLDADKARRAAKELLAKVTLGGDPQGDKEAERKRAADTYGSVVDLYLTAKAATLRPKSLKEAKRYLKKHAKAFDRVPVHKIGRRDIAARLAAIGNGSSRDGSRGLRGGPTVSDHARTALHGFFTWATREGFVDENPVINAGHPEQSKSRERALAAGELVEVWNATEDDDYGKIVRLLILTAQRREEVAGMSWSELNEREGTWIIPKERAKNKREHKITLSNAAWAIIKSVDKRPGRDLLFGRKGPFSGFSKAKLAIDARILKARREAPKKAGTPVDDVKPDPWLLHDLRRTAATMMGEELGIQPHVVESLLNHISGTKRGIAGVYNRATYATEVKTALARWAGHVRSLVEGGDRNVVPLEPSARG